MFENRTRINTDERGFFHSWWRAAVQVNSSEFKIDDRKFTNFPYGLKRNLQSAPIKLVQSQRLDQFFLVQVINRI